MHDGFSGRALLSVGKQVRHYVVTDGVFQLLGTGVVDVSRMRAHLCNLLVGNIQSELLFRFGKGNPQLAPSAEFEIGGKHLLHCLACIALAKRRYVTVVAFHCYLPQKKCPNFSTSDKKLKKN